MMLRRLAVCLVFLVGMFGAARMVAAEEGAWVTSADVEMNAATAKARKTLDDFLKLAAKPPRGAEGFKLNVLMRDARGAEYLWIRDFAQDRAGFHGVVDTDPAVLKSIRRGQRVTFQRSDVTDWGYVLDGRETGFATMCVLLKRMSPAAAEQYRKERGLRC